MKSRAHFGVIIRSFALTLLALPGLSAGEVELISAQTPWRLFVVGGSSVYRKDDGSLELRHGHKKTPFDPAKGDAATLQGSPLPPADWTQAPVAVAHWPRLYFDEIAHSLGGWGRYDGNQGNRGRTVVQLALRTRFGVADPAAVKGLKVTVRYLGGVVVFVNGREIGRNHLGKGGLDPTRVLAEDYPKTAYATEEGRALPGLKGESEPKKWLDQYESRIRSFTVTVPAMPW